MSKIDAVFGSPPEREGLVVQLFVEEGQWGEVTAESEKLMLELYPKHKGGAWVLDLDEVLKVLQISKQKLEESKGSPNDGSTILPPH